VPIILKSGSLYLLEPTGPLVHKLKKNEEPPSCADYLKICESQPPGTHRAIGAQIKKKNWSHLRVPIILKSGSLYLLEPTGPLVHKLKKKLEPPSCADYFEIWEPQPPGTHRAIGAQIKKKKLRAT